MIIPVQHLHKVHSWCLYALPKVMHINTNCPNKHVASGIPLGPGWTVNEQTSEEPRQ